MLTQKLYLHCKCRNLFPGLVLNPSTVPAPRVRFVGPGRNNHCGVYSLQNIVNCNRRLLHLSDSNIDSLDLMTGGGSFLSCFLIFKHIYLVNFLNSKKKKWAGDFLKYESSLCSHWSERVFRHYNIKLERTELCCCLVVWKYHLKQISASFSLSHLVQTQTGLYSLTLVHDLFSGSCGSLDHLFIMLTFHKPLYAGCVLCCQCVNGGFTHYNSPQSLHDGVSAGLSDSVNNL